MAFSENSKLVYNVVKENNGKLTAKDIAAMLDMSDKSVNGIVTSAFQRKGFMERIEAERELDDGTHEKVKLVALTPAGEELDVDAE